MGNIWKAAERNSVEGSFCVLAFLMSLKSLPAELLLAMQFLKVMVTVPEKSSNSERAVQIELEDCASGRRERRKPLT